MTVRGVRNSWVRLVSSDALQPGHLLGLLLRLAQLALGPLSLGDVEGAGEEVGPVAGVEALERGHHRAHLAGLPAELKLDLAHGLALAENLHDVRALLRVPPQAEVGGAVPDELLPAEANEAEEGLVRVDEGAAVEAGDGERRRAEVERAVEELAEAVWHACRPLAALRRPLRLRRGHLVHAAGHARERRGVVGGIGGEGDRPRRRPLGRLLHFDEGGSGPLLQRAPVQRPRSLGFEEGGERVGPAGVGVHHAPLTEAEGEERRADGGEEPEQGLLLALRQARPLLSFWGTRSGPRPARRARLLLVPTYVFCSAFLHPRSPLRSETSPAPRRTDRWDPSLRSVARARLQARREAFPVRPN